MLSMNHHTKTGAQQGFTLIELVIVLAVLGALAAIAVPQLTGFQGDAELQGTATATSSELNNQFANDLVSDDMGPWDSSGNVCGNIGDGSGSASIVADALVDSGFSVASDASGFSNDSVEMTVPEYNTGTEEVSEVTCFLGS